MENEEKKTLAEIDRQFQSLNEYLKQNEIEGKEYDAIVGPLAETVKNLQFKTNLRWFAKAGIRCLFFIAFIYFIFQIYWFNKIFSVLGRLILIQILPFWDWTRIYYSDCILTNPFYVRRILAQEDCKLCVSPTSLQRLHDVTPKMIWEEYLLNDRPFIVEDGMKDWPVMNTNNFWFDNITDLYLSKEQEGIEPCEFGTNLRMPSNDLQKFLRTIHNPNIKHWFGHWENCDKRAAKALRPFYKRPYFIPNLVDLSDSNWVLMSSNYFSKNFHQIDFSTELLWVAQLRGWSKFRLAPREPCSTSCLPIDASIKEGQMVVLTNFLWEFEYIPGEETDNLAIAVGGDWN